MNNAARDIEQMLIDDAARFYDDPYGFVMYAYPWGVEGTPLEISRVRINGRRIS